MKAPFINHEEMKLQSNSYVRCIYACIYNTDCKKSEKALDKLIHMCYCIKVNSKGAGEFIPQHFLFFKGSVLLTGSI